MNVAYNTGKVRIGCHYLQMARMPSIYGDALTLQLALINKRQGGLFERVMAAIWRAA